MIADGLIADQDAAIQVIEKQVCAQLVGIARQWLERMHLGHPGLARQQHRIEAEIGADIEERLQPVLTDQCPATRNLRHLIGPADDQLLIDPVAVVQQPALFEPLIDGEARSQPIQSLEDAPMQFTHEFATPSACQ